MTEPEKAAIRDAVDALQSAVLLTERLAVEHLTLRKAIERVALAIGRLKPRTEEQP